MLAFGTLFSCQGAQSSHSCCQRADDPVVAPIQSESEATRKCAVPVFQWVAGEFFSSRESNSTDTPELVKSRDESDESALAHLQDPADQGVSGGFLCPQDLSVDPDGPLGKHPSRLGSREP